MPPHQGLAARRAPPDIEKQPLIPGRNGPSTYPTSSGSSGDDTPSPPPSTNWIKENRRPYRRRLRPHFSRQTNEALTLILAAVVFFAFCGPSLPVRFDFPWPSPTPRDTPDFIKEGIEQCEIIAHPPPNPAAFDQKRHKSDRFVPGTKDTLLRNATLWTGNQQGEEVLSGVDIYLSGGVVRRITKSKDSISLDSSDGRRSDRVSEAGKKDDVDEVNLHGAWVTPGIVDMHSHMGVDSSPELRGSDDTNSLKAPVLPYLRSMDGFNTHDQAFNLSISGGITTILVLPGSAGNIGGQAFTFKPRQTAENTPQSMQVEPPWEINTSASMATSHGHGNSSWVRNPKRWRHIKHACGENPARVYGNTRMDSAWDFRRAYDEGRKLKEEQDRWCADPKSQKEPFPRGMEWEVLADVIRGKVLVNIHCYETVDLNTLVRISNEYRFRIAAFHHAHETYLVPSLLSQAYGPPPAVALFATNARYKREAYRGTEFAPKILADAGFRVSMKSDHPVLDSRYLVYEAAQAHHYGLNFSQAMSSVTSHSAESIGLGHRLGYVREGYDADLVVWDSFPLSLGATPAQVYIDGIRQLEGPHVVRKPQEAQEVTKEGKWDKEIKETLETRGEPDLWPKEEVDSVVFVNVREVYARFGPRLGKRAQVRRVDVLEGGRVVVQAGDIACIGTCAHDEVGDFKIIDLKGGSITPGLLTVGSYVGLMDIRQEKTTQDGSPYDPTLAAAEIVDGVLTHGVDGAQFGGKDALLAFRSGVTRGVAYPSTSSLFSGLSFLFSTSAAHALAPHAILDPSAALHLDLTGSGGGAQGGSKMGVSTKLAVLRRLLTSEANNETEVWSVVRQVKRGERRVVVLVNKADTMAALVRLKREWAPGMKMTFMGAQEAWMIADDIAREDIGVIVSPARAFPFNWDSRRIMPGPPLSNQSLPAYLSSRGILVGLGITEEWMARNTRNDAAWVYANNPEVFSKADALALVGDNLEELLGLNERERERERVGVYDAVGEGEGKKDWGQEQGQSEAQEHQTTHDGLVMQHDQADAVRGLELSGWVAWEGDWTSLEGRVRAVRPASASASASASDSDSGSSVYVGGRGGAEVSAVKVSILY